jgi:hypothetical protein
MRRIHWWNGAIGAGAIAAAAFVAPTAMAAHHPSPVKPKVRTVAQVTVHPPARHRVVVSSHGEPQHVYHHGGPGDPGCSYPPSGTAHITLGGPDHARRSSVVSLSGSVKVNACGYAGFPTGLYSSDDGKRHWKQVSTTTSDDKGNYSFRYTVLHTVYLRAVVAGGDGYGATQSDVLHLPVQSRQR